jgi:RecB family endonuclease NucS
MTYTKTELKKNKINKLYAIGEYNSIDVYELDFGQDAIFFRGDIHDEYETIKQFLENHDDLYDNFMDAVKNHSEYASIKVNIIARDRFSGPELLETKLFKSKDEAVKFCEKYNSKNTETHAPDYYSYAEIV